MRNRTREGGPAAHLFFETMEVALRSGRLFSDSDTERAAGVVIVDERLARRFWGEKSPLGRRMYSPGSAQDVTKPGPDSRWYTVVGVVSEIRISGLVETDDRVGACYFPLAQQPRRGMTLTVRGASDSAALVPAIRRELAALDLPARRAARIDPLIALNDALCEPHEPMNLMNLMNLYFAALGT